MSRKEVKMIKYSLFILLLFASLLWQGCQCLKLLRVSVPQYTLRGEMALLQCQFDLQSDRLYSVTWYKDQEEFYRFVPKSNPPQHSYRLDGVKVDHHLSDSQQVLLRNVNLKATGDYRCEVSAEAPSFTSVHGEGRMEVVALPTDDPEISGEERVYQVGDILDLNCTSGSSYPPARLRWYVNDQPVGPDYEVVIQQHGLLASLAGLRFEVGPDHFSSGHMKVRCVSTISTSRDDSFDETMEPLIDNREALLLLKGQAGSDGVSVFVTLVLTSLSAWLNT